MSADDQTVERNRLRARPRGQPCGECQLLLEAQHADNKNGLAVVSETLLR